MKMFLHSIEVIYSIFIFNLNEFYIYVWCCAVKFSFIFCICTEKREKKSFFIWWKNATKCYRTEQWKEHVIKYKEWDFFSQYFILCFIFHLKLGNTEEAKTWKMCDAVNNIFKSIFNSSHSHHRRLIFNPQKKYAQQKSLKLDEIYLNLKLKKISFLKF